MPDYTLAEREFHDDLNGEVTILVDAKAPQEQERFLRERCVGPDGSAAPRHKLLLRVTFAIDPQQGAGDGTVPLTSGAAPTPYCRQMFRHEGAEKHQPGYDHMTAYDNNDIATSVTLYSIAHMLLRPREEPT